MSHDRDTLFLKVAIKNKLLDTEKAERVLNSIAQRKEIGSTKNAWEVAVELNLLSPQEAEAIRQVVEQALPPRQIAGFKIEAPIGKGAVGTVYRAKQLSLDKLVAVKLLHPNHTTEERFVSDFLREAKSVAKLNHPNIVHAIDAGSEDGRHYFAMEYVEGESLRQKLDRRDKLSPAETLDIAQQVAAGLGHAHSQGILHRDLKPENILIGEDGRARIVDLGLAIPIDDAELLAAEHKKQGTPYYLSPEQAKNGEIDARSDLYSFGATLYHCLAGKPVFTGGTVKEILTKQVHQDPAPISEAVGTSSSLDPVVMKLLSKDPSERYGNAEECLAALNLAARSDPQKKRPPGTAPRSRKRSATGTGRGSKTRNQARSGGSERSGRKSSSSPGKRKKIEILTHASQTRRYRKKNSVPSMVGVGCGALISVFLVISAVNHSEEVAAQPNAESMHLRRLASEANRDIAKRIENWKKEQADAERKARERTEQIVRNAETDNLRRRGLEKLLQANPDREAAMLMIAELEKVSDRVRAARIAGPAELLSEAEGLREQGKLWVAYLLLDDRPRSARKDQEMNQTIEQFLSDLEEEIDGRVVSDLALAREKLAKKDFAGALALAEGVHEYADEKSTSRADELANQIKKTREEYTKAEALRRLNEEREGYLALFNIYRTAAMSREFKEAISAAIELQAEMSTKEIQDRLEIDLTAFGLLDQFTKQALTQLLDTKSSGKPVRLEMKPRGEATRGRRYDCKINRIEGSTVFIEVDRAVFPIDVADITDQTIFDLVLERHGESSPDYLIPLGVLFLYRGNYDIARSHFSLAAQNGVRPDTWVNHLEYIQQHSRN